MRLIVAGSTGFVGTEVIRQALSIPVITSIVAGGRCLYLLKTTPWEHTVKVCRGFARRGVETTAQLPRKKGKNPFRFVYVSGNNAERDQTKRPIILGDYCLLRGQAETLILEYAKQSNGAVEACIAKPGLIGSPDKKTPMLQKALFAIIGRPKIQVSEISAAMLYQVVNGFETDTLVIADMVRDGQKFLAEHGL